MFANCLQISKKKDYNLEKQVSFLERFFLLDIKKQFDIYFKNLFPGIRKSKATNITSNFATVVTKDLENIKIDFNSAKIIIFYYQ